MKRVKLSTFSLLLLIAVVALSGCLGPKTGNLTGTVKWESGDAIVGATVKLGDASTTTNENGAYSFKNIRPGTYTLAVLQDDMLLTQRQIKIQPGENVQNIVVSEDSGTLQGTVVNRAGRPIAGATVSIGALETTTDNDGRFVFTDLPLASYEVTVTKGGQALADPVNVTLEGPSTVLDPIVGQRIVSLGKSYTYQLKGPHPSYPDTDLKEMTDGIIGPNSYSNPAWTAVWYNDTFHIIFDLEEQVNVYQVRIHMLAGTAGIYYPSRFIVSVSNDGSTWTPVAELNVTDPQPTQSQVKWFEIDEIDAAGRYVRLSITFDPEVSNGGGHNMFLSEVEIYE